MAAPHQVTVPSIHLVIDAVGIRPESGGIIVLGDILRAAAEHPSVARTTVFASGGTQLDLRLSTERQRIVGDVAASRPALLAWNMLGLEARATKIGGDAIVSMNGLGRARRLPMFVLFQQQLMFAPQARARMGWRFRARLALLKRLSARACRSAALVFAQAEHVRESLVRELRVPPQRVHVIPPDVSWQEGPNEPTEREAGLLVYVGSNRAHKSLETLLEAFRLVRAQLPEALLQLTLPAAHVPSQAGVVALGRLDRQAVQRLLRRAQVLVMPSLAETVGLPLLEAMDLGCAIVVSDLPYAREVSGGAASFFAPGDARACSVEILKLLRDAELRTTLAIRGKLLLEQRRARTPYKELLDRIVSRVGA